MAKIIEVLQGKDGNFSYKRFTGFLAFFVAVALAFMNKDHILVGSFLTYSASCGAFTIPDDINMKGRR